MGIFTVWFEIQTNDKLIDGTWTVCALRIHLEYFVHRDEDQDEHGRTSRPVVGIGTN